MLTCTQQGEKKGGPLEQTNDTPDDETPGRVQQPFDEWLLKDYPQYQVVPR